MKEATGELNLTLIVAIIVAMLSLFFFYVLWPNIKGNIALSSNCDAAICECPDGYRDQNGTCTYKGTSVECYAKGNPNKKFICTWKG